jgi:ABC-type transport system substrate-binding protein
MSRNRISVKLTLKLLVIIILLMSISIYPNNRAEIYTQSGEKKINTQDPLFHVDIVDNLNTFFAHYAHILARELEKVGISCDVHLVNYYTKVARTSWYGEGKAYDEGGFDISSMNIFYDDYSTHPLGALNVRHSPYSEGGYNFQFWSSEEGDYNYRAAEAELLVQLMNKNLNYTDIREDLFEYQKIYYDAMPGQEVLIFTDLPFAISTGLYGLDPYFHPLNSIETMWNDTSYVGNKGEVIFAAESIFPYFNPMLSSYWWTRHISSPVMDSLLGFIPSRELILPSNMNRETWMNTNFETTNFLDVYPRVASDLGIFSKNGLQYNITIQKDVFWHDGHPLDAWDVAFSFQAYLLPEINYNSYLWTKLHSFFGYDDANNHHGIYSFIVEDRDLDGFYESISFNFQNESTAIFVEPELLTLPLLPEHILGDPTNHGYNSTSALNPMQQWLVPPTKWKTHSYHTGNSSDLGGLNGPIGCGPVIFESYDPETSSILYKKFEDIQWDNVSHNWVTTNPNNDHFLVKTGKLTEMPSTIRINTMDFESALEAMKLGSVNILDPDLLDKAVEYWYPLHPHQERSQIFKEIEENDAIQAVYAYGPGRLWLTTFQNPRFQTSTELGENDTPFTRKGVRHAISHIIPREVMCEYLLYGLGTPATSLLQYRYSELPESDLLSYKRLLKATDGSIPLADSNSIWDSYDRQLALDWLETEGYNVDAWRNYLPPDPPNWVTDDPQQWDSSIKKGSTLEFTIETLRDENDSSEWYWEIADVTLHEGDPIKITWNADPETDNILCPGYQFGDPNDPVEKVNYTISVSIGGRGLDAVHSQQFIWFLFPLITTNGMKEFEPGILAAERYFPNSFKLIGIEHQVDMKFLFAFDVEGFPSIHDIGKSAAFNDEINANIFTFNYSTMLEDRLFNLTYDARTGILKRLTFTNTQGGDPSSGVVDTDIVEGLQKLEIIGPERVSSTPEQSPDLSTTPIPSLSTESLTTPSSGSGWSIALVLVIFSVLVMLRRRNWSKR